MPGIDNASHIEPVDPFSADKLNASSFIRGDVGTAPVFRLTAGAAPFGEGGRALEGNENR